MSGSTPELGARPPHAVQSVERRSLLNWLLGTSLGAMIVSILYPVARFLNPPEVKTAATNEADAGLANDPEFVDKGYKIVRFGSEPVIVIRLSETSFRAFSAVCTHLACIVEFAKPQQQIVCNCHNGHFNLEGQVTSGPPPRPLTPYGVHLVAQSGAAVPRVIVSRA